MNLHVGEEGNVEKMKKEKKERKEGRMEGRKENRMYSRCVLLFELSHGARGGRGGRKEGVGTTENSGIDAQPST